jgi:hypothetical protein
MNKYVLAVKPVDSDTLTDVELETTEGVEETYATILDIINDLFGDVADYNAKEEAELLEMIKSLELGDDNTIIIGANLEMEYEGVEVLVYFNGE